MQWLCIVRMNALLNWRIHDRPPSLLWKKHNTAGQAANGDQVHAVRERAVLDLRTTTRETLDRILRMEERYLTATLHDLRGNHDI